MASLWPASALPLATAELAARAEALAPAFLRLLATLNLPSELNNDLPGIYLPLAAWLAQQTTEKKPLLVGVNGSQGSGKSTLCTLLSGLLEVGFAQRCCVLSLDDLYLTRDQRQALAAQVHPLLVTRGVPGTHDVALGLQLFESLSNASEDSRIPIPRFDKALDDRVTESSREIFVGCPDLILFEGWCVGAVAQPEEELEQPVNDLEAAEDRDGRWRGYVNRQLAEVYSPLFARLDLLLMLKIPSWEMVDVWRSKQEAQLATRNTGRGVMTKSALQRFIMHYERLTRHQLVEMPPRANLILELNENQRVVQVIKKSATT